MFWIFSTCGIWPVVITRINTDVMNKNLKMYIQLSQLRTNKYVIIGLLLLWVTFWPYFIRELRDVSGKIVDSDLFTPPSLAIEFWLGSGSFLPPRTFIMLLMLQYLIEECYTWSPPDFNIQLKAKYGKFFWYILICTIKEINSYFKYICALQNFERVF